MDIDDILASIDRHGHHHGHGQGHGHDDFIATPESTTLDHQLLTRFWVAERAVSELLPWPASLMERMLRRVRRQIELIEDMAASCSSSSSYDMDTNTNSKTNAKSNANTNLTLRLSILQTDLSRTQFLIRSLLRQRLAKLTSHSMYYLQLVAGPAPPSASAVSSQQQSSSSSSSTSAIQPEDSVPDPSNVLDPSPLSPEEASFLHAHQMLLAGHFGASFLGSFPGNLRRLDDNAGGTSMVQGPDLKEVVFVRCLNGKKDGFADDGGGGGGGGHGVRIVVPPGDGIEEEIEGSVTMRTGDVWVVRWEGVRALWERGVVEVL